MSEEKSPEQSLAAELSSRSGRSVGKLTLVLVGAVLMVAGFAGGVVFNKATASAGTATPGPQGQFGPGPGGNRTPGANGPGAFGPEGGFVTGTVSAVSGDTVTVKLADGSTKQVRTSASTTVTLSQTGSLSDLKSGDTIAVRGDEASDGTVAAQSIAEGDGGFGRSAPQQQNN